MNQPAHNPTATAPAAPHVSSIAKGVEKPVVKNPPTPGEPKAEKAAKAPKAPKEPKPPKESNFKKVYPDTAKIHLKAAANPKREGSKAHATFSLYKDGMTVADFLKAGGYYAALSWDVGHGFVTVT